MIYYCRIKGEKIQKEKGEKDAREKKVNISINFYINNNSN